MAKRIAFDMVYEAPLATVAAMLSDPAFREEVCDEQKALSKTVRIDGGVDAKTVRIEMVQPTEGVPGFAKKVVGDTTTVIQSETWTSPADATVDIEIPGKPGQISGFVKIVEKVGVCTETVTLDATVKIPLIGGKLEDLVLSMIRSALKREQIVGTRYLAR
ncbi:DUF2505 domain-containing protein [Nocardioides montaniterrae]